MKKVLIFSGTTEGRSLAELLCEAGIGCEVCVATEYGKEVMTPGKNLVIHQGRLEEAAMTELMKTQAFAAVVDATHPYAVEVSRHVAAGAASAGLPYLRLKRDTALAHGEAARYPDITYVDSAASCAKHLKGCAGNILLTTGSKELSCYTQEESLQERLYVRVLPGMESIALCSEQGICGRRVIAMHGPFSTDLNEALLRQYEISVLVTKQSGHVGGFAEKLEAARRTGASVVVIGNPDAAPGESPDEVLARIARITGAKISELQITLVGFGMGNVKLLTEEAKQALLQADYLLGASRLLEAVPKWMNGGAQREAIYRAEDILPVLVRIQKSRMRGKVAVVFSGDTGFYSGAEALQDALSHAIRERRICAKVQVCPGISSLSYLAARAGISWQDAKIMSIHGRDGNVAAAVGNEKKVFLLVSGAADMRRLGEELLGMEQDGVQLTVGYQMSYPRERLLRLTPRECMELREDGLYACIIQNPNAKPHSLTPGYADHFFERDQVPMTKEEVREVSLCKLGLCEGAVLYDVGSGTGSIAVEAAALSDTVAVYAIEQKELARALIQKNSTKACVHNVHIVAGRAPECMEGLPVPTHAFIGGSGGNLRDILDCLYQKNNMMRVVINAVSLETLAEITALRKTLPVCGAETIQLQVSRARQAGGYQLMQAENPVYIVSFYFAPPAPV